ncbi:MAG: B12-binding domain-containing radical SAM protein [Bacteroidota bacterium]
MSKTVFLITPPFTQLNTPYPATAYLKGFLNTKNISSFQSDLGIEVIIEIFSKIGLNKVFSACPSYNDSKWSLISENARRIISLKEDYINSIDPVIDFLQGKQPTLAHLISKRNFLPEANRFLQLDDLQWAFGSMGVHDKAKHIATMYLEDISDLIKECVDEHFGFSRYAERLGRSANSFDELYQSLNSPSTFVDDILMNIIDKRITTINPIMLAISIPFPGNLYSGFRIAQFVKQKFPSIKITMGGGFANTELRSIKDPRVFEFFDYITLDDGEAPIENLIQYIKGDKKEDELKRTFLLKEGVVTYFNNSACADYKQTQVGTPDYSDLHLDKYIQAIEIINPMHSLWSNGRWNKLTMAHGCYWGKCTFCDVSLDYIKRYEPLTAIILCDRIEEMIAQTGETGFHFVDEAAPPSLMRALAIEIVKRKLVISWWTNIRFEKSFTKDLCYLLKASGCIGVSGGLEVASDRLLELINKGVTVSQVAKVNRNFTEAGIMVHAYLMYGFPTQTAQETIDSLEMVRQMFHAGILQSAFWHQFAMTAHSPVGLAPEKFNVKKAKEVEINFADNDVEHIDLSGIDHTIFGFGLKKSLLNYMHNVGLEEPLHKWFDMKIPRTTVSANFIADAIDEAELHSYQPSSKVIFIGHLPAIEVITKSKKGNQWELASLTFETKSNSINIKVDKAQGVWLFDLLNTLKTKSFMTMQEVMSDYTKAELEDFELFWDNKPVNQLCKIGLFIF